MQQLLLMKGLGKSSRFPCSDRFRDGMGLLDRETAAFEQYFYHITAARGSGEHALRHILGPFAWAREALEEELKDIKVTATKGVLINQSVVPVQRRCLGEHALPQPGALCLGAGRPRRRASGYQGALLLLLVP